MTRPKPIGETPLLDLMQPERDATFGPAYSGELDGERVAGQMEEIRDFMLRHWPYWFTLAEIETALDHPQASISAQLRHLRKLRFGSYLVEKRRREPEGAQWEYRCSRPMR